MRHHLHRMHEAVLRSAPIRPGDRILYVGCDRGAFTPAMADQLARSSELVAVDFSQVPLQRVERLMAQVQRKNFLFFRLSQPLIPFADEYFDLVIAYGSQHALPRPDLVLDELDRVLKPEGRLYWHDVDPTAHRPWTRLVNWLFFWRKRPASAQTLSDVRRRMSRYFTIEFYRRWTHTWGRQSCLLVGRKPRVD
ncbi:MAG: class I SAM-dependent methyltransferase [Candidatus Sericytochromatia bacterium]|nr:class I SAM-dependent methyltransferase [Candidatus Sericytochromatia bacterium]